MTDGDHKPPATGQSVLPARRAGDSSPHAGLGGVGDPSAAETPQRPRPAPRPAPSAPAGEPLPRRRRRGGETYFKSLTTVGGATVLAIIAAIAVFLVVEAVPALTANEENFFTYTKWDPNALGDARFGIAALAYGTVLSAAIALVVAVPVAVGIALYLSHYAHRRVATVLGFAVDLLAAVPSVVFGLWGREFFAVPVRDFSVWLNEYFGWIPLFAGDGAFGHSVLLGSLVLAIMILPIVTSLTREVFAQTPREHEEAAMALGATKWEVVRTAVLPYGRPGIVASVMLGLGRALGETIALAMTLGSSFVISASIVEPGGNTIAANIANTFGEANDQGRSALIASGLVLFAITLIVNMGARAIVRRRKRFLAAAAA